MRTFNFICALIVVSCVSAPALRAQNTESGVATPTVYVDDDKVQCPYATFSTIQSAIDAASPGERIRVCAGTYNEQLTIDKSVTVSAENGVALSPVGMTANASSLSGSETIATAILVKNATAVEIDGFLVDGSGNGIVECGPRLIGILFQNASGTVAHNAVRHFRLNSSLLGCQSGNAIEVETASGANSIVIISDNSADDYQKNGITANETGTSVTIDGNTVVGIGSTSGAAQNGIQVGFGAAGTITNNSVTNHMWAGCVSTAQCDTNAAGILVFDSDGIRVGTNSVGLNQIGIFVGGNKSRVESNKVFNSLVLDGVAIVGNSNFVHLNEISQSDEAAVSIQGNNNQIQSNEFLSAIAGILTAPGSTGTVHYGNQYFAIMTKNVDAESADAKAAIASGLNSAKSSTAVANGIVPSKKRVSPSR